MTRNPQFMETLINALTSEYSKNAALENKVDELTPKAHYCDIVLLGGEVIPTSTITNNWNIKKTKKNKRELDL